MSLKQLAQDPWGDFWAANEGAVGGGCLPTRWAGIDTAQREAWQDFARQMPKHARVLDLATGDGRVMGWLLGVRRDLKCLGVDLAPSLPEPPKGSRSRGGTAMERLPFADLSQDVVTSQFGFEYGDAKRVLSEIARVLKPGGRTALMTHRLDGVILAHNLPRRQGLLWALDDVELIERARASVALRAVVPGVASAIKAAPDEAKRRFGAGSAAWEFAEAISVTLALGVNDRPQNVLNLLKTLEAKARNEIGRIDSLEKACHSASDEATLKRRFGQAGFCVTSHSILKDGGTGRTFASWWVIRHD